MARAQGCVGSSRSAPIGSAPSACAVPESRCCTQPDQTTQRGACASPTSSILGERPSRLSSARAGWLGPCGLVKPSNSGIFPTTRAPARSKKLYGGPGHMKLHKVNVEDLYRRSTEAEIPSFFVSDMQYKDVFQDGELFAIDREAERGGEIVAYGTRKQGRLRASVRVTVDANQTGDPDGVFGEFWRS